MALVTMRDLLEAGIHFGHQTRRWNPKMKPFIFGQRNGIYIIDLQKTVRQLKTAYKQTREAVAHGGTVLFVGTKKQAQEAVEREARRCGMYFVNNRWLGGTLTNWATVRQSIRTLTKLEEMETSGDIEKRSKKEQARLRRERAKLDKNLRGIKTMDRLPAIMFIIDTKKEAIAVREAERLGITSIGVVDTNGDPDTVTIPIPGNDDAIRAVSLFCRVIAEAVLDGMALGEKIRAEEKKKRIEESAARAASREVKEAAAGKSVETTAALEDDTSAEADPVEAVESAE